MGRRRRGDPCISRSLRGQPIDQLDGDGVHVGRGLGAYAGGGLLRGGLVGGLGNGGLHLGKGVVALLLRLGQLGVHLSDLFLARAAGQNQIGQRVQGPVHGIGPVLRQHAEAFDRLAAFLGAHGGGRR